jgi:UDPglucose 6-dehydrogenase
MNPIKNTFLVKICSLSLAFYLAFHPCALEASFVSDLLKIEDKKTSSSYPDFLSKIPSHLATLHVLQPAHSSEIPFVIHIQDAHANPEAQSRIKDLLKWIVEESSKFKSASLLIGLEGAEGDLHPEYFNFFKNLAEINHAMVEDLFKKGEVTGGELFAWEMREESGRKIQFKGVEDQKLFERNLYVYKNLTFHENSFKKDIQPLKDQLDLLRSNLKSQELKEFLETRSKLKQGHYGAHKITPQFMPYISKLREYALKNLRIDFQDPIEQLRFPQMARVFALAELEKKSLQNLDAEKNSLFDEMEQHTSSENGQAFFTILEKIQKKQVTRLDLEALWELCDRTGINLSKYPSFLTAMGISLLQSELNFEVLETEIHQLESWMIAKCAVDPADKAFAELSEDWDLFEKILLLEISREEYGVLRKEVKRFAPDQFRKRITVLRHVPSLKVTKKLSKRFDLAIEFYKLAEKRDMVLLQNLLREAKGKSLAVLITGGFHTSGIIEEMKRKGMGYAVLTPTLLNEPDPSLLKKVFKNQNADVSLYLKNSALDKRERLILKELVEVGIPLLRKMKSLSESHLILSETFQNHPIVSKQLGLSVSSEVATNKLKLSYPQKTESARFIKPSLQAVTEALMLRKLSPSKPKLKTAEADLVLPEGSTPKDQVRAETRMSESEQKQVREMLRNQSQHGALYELYKNSYDSEDTGVSDPIFLELAKELASSSHASILGLSNRIKNDYREMSETWYSGFRMRNDFERLSRDPINNAPALKLLRQWIVEFLYEAQVDPGAKPKPGPQSHLFEGARWLLLEINKLQAKDESALSIGYKGVSRANLTGATRLINQGHSVRISDEKLLERITSTEQGNADLKKLLIEGKLLPVENGNGLTTLLKQNKVVVINSELVEGLDYHEHKKNYFDLAGNIGRALRQLRDTGDTERRVIILRDHLGVRRSDSFYWAIVRELGGIPNANFDVVYQPNITQKNGDGRTIEPLPVFGLRDVANDDDRRDREATKVLLQRMYPRAREIKWINIRSAELAFESYLILLASKLTHFRDLAAMAQAIRADMYVIAFGAGLDRRIGFRYINPSLAFGGQLAMLLEWIRQDRLSRIEDPDLESKLKRAKEIFKDPEVNAADALAKLGVKPENASGFQVLLLLETIKDINHQSLEDAVKQITDQLQRPYENKTVAILGVGYSENEAQITMSPTLTLIKRLVSKGVKQFRISDPVALPALQRWIKSMRESPQHSDYASVTFRGAEEGDEKLSIYDAVKGADITVVAQESHPDLRTLDLEELSTALGGKPFFDAIGLFGRRANGSELFSLQKVRDHKINLISFGRPPLNAATDSHFYQDINDLKKRGIKKTSKNITIIGAGYVGLVTAAYFAKIGHNVTVFDKNKARIEQLSQAPDEIKSPILEKDLEETLREAARAGRFHAVSDLNTAMANSDVVYVAVGTPQKEDGTADLSYVESVATDLANYYVTNPPTKPTPIVIKSTVPNSAFTLTTGIFDAKRLDRSMLAWVSSPEFLKEGTALADVERPDRTVIGLPSFLEGETRDQFEKMMLEVIYAIVEHHDHYVLVTDTQTATSIKYASNAFLAVSITVSYDFANDAATSDADFEEVRDVHRSLAAIGPDFFNDPGCWAGSCFPKDVRAAFAFSIAVAQHPLRLSQLIDAQNDLYKRSGADAVEKNYRKRGKATHDEVIALLGMTFKGDTDDMRESASAALLYYLLKNRAREVRIHDPSVNDPTKADNPKKIKELHDNYLDQLYANHIRIDDEFNKAFNKFKDGLTWNSTFIVRVARALKINLKEIQEPTARERAMRRILSRLGERQVQEKAKYIFYKRVYSEDPTSPFYKEKIVFVNSVDKTVTGNNPDTDPPATQIVLATKWSDYKKMTKADFERLKTLSKGRLQGLVDTRNAWHDLAINGDLADLGFDYIGIGIPDIAQDAPRFIWPGIHAMPADAVPVSPIRAEVRIAPMALPTALFRENLSSTPEKENRFFSASEIKAIRQTSRLSAVGLYSVEDVSFRYEKKYGLKKSEADGYALSFVVNLILDRKDKVIAPFTPEEEEALAPIIDIFSGENSHNGKPKFRLVESYEDVPVIDSALRLRLRYLASNPDVNWTLKLSAVSKTEAKQYLEALVKQAEAWNIPLNSGQILIEGNVHDVNLPYGWIGDPKSVNRTPITPNLLFRKLASSESVVRLAEWLLAAEALRNEIKVPNPFDGPASDLAQPSRFTVFLQSVQNYSKISLSA